MRHACVGRPAADEDPITEQGRFKRDLSLACANAEQSGISTGQPLLAQTGPNSWVNIPTQIGERRDNIDIILGASHGFTAQSTLSVNIKTNASGQVGADLRIHWLRQF